MRRLACVIFGLLFCAAPLDAQNSDADRVLPGSFQANRVYVHPVTASGDTLNIITDSGGGLYLYRDVAERLGLSVRDTTVRGRSFPVSEPPKIVEPEWFPAFPTSPIVFRRSNPRVRMLEKPDEDGLIGASWYGGHIWTLDYSSGEMVLHASSDGLALDSTHTIPMGFPTDDDGERRSSYPSIEATIAGESHPFLLDTGATLLLSDRGQRALGGPRFRGGSFVVASVFERWRERHPEWRVIEGGSVYGGGTPIIRVPEVTIAGHTVGPVWFARRPDGNFRKHMAKFMDRPVDGALGGSLFQYFELTLDYPGARAHFRLSALSEAERKGDIPRLP